MQSKPLANKSTIGLLLVEQDAKSQKDLLGNGQWAGRELLKTLPRSLGISPKPECQPFCMTNSFLPGCISLGEFTRPLSQSYNVKHCKSTVKQGMHAELFFLFDQPEGITKKTHRCLHTHKCRKLPCCLLVFWQDGPSPLPSEYTDQSCSPLLHVLTEIWFYSRTVWQKPV